MSEPQGEVVDRRMVTRACGCVQEYTVHARDRYWGQRLAKFQGTRCPACVAKLQEQQRAAAAALPGPAEALDRLPAGAQMVITRRPDGAWVGTLTVGGKAVDGECDGARGLVVALARQWAAGEARSG